VTNSESIDAARLLVSRYEPTPPQKLYLYDDTLRDGEQTIGVAFSLEQKLEIAQKLIDAGIWHMTLGFPAVSESEREIVSELAKLDRSEGFYAIARCIPSDFEVVLDCGVKKVGTWIPISDSHLRHKLRVTEDQAFDMMIEGIRVATSMNVPVRFALEDATRAPYERIARFARGAIDAGAEAITIADTCGILTPNTAFGLFKDLRALIGPDAHLVAHFHNDLGMATANSLMAYLGGASMIQGSFAGLGERTGNVALEELATALIVKFDADIGVDLVKLKEIAYLVASYAGMAIAPSKPVLGKNIFCHESGVHVQGIMRNPATYEPYPPALIGSEHQIHFGKHSGLSGIQHVATAEGITASDADMRIILNKVKVLGEDGHSSTRAEIAKMLAEVQA